MSEGAVMGGEVPTGGEAAPAGEVASVAGILGTESSGDQVVQGSGGDAPAWASGLDADSMAFIGTKGWDKSEAPVGEILKSYRNLERLRGVSADKLVKIPEEGDAEGMAELRARLGVPEAPDAYEVADITVGDGKLDGEPLAAIAHKAQLDPQQFAAFQEGIGEYVNGVLAQQAEAQALSMESQRQEVLREWGNQADVNTVAADRAMARHGVTAEEVGAMASAVGLGKVLGMFAAIGRETGEHVRGDDTTRQDPPGGAISPDAAREMMRQRSADDGFREKLLSGDLAAKKEWMDLSNIVRES